MKSYSFKIDKWQAGDFFAPVRSKKDVINLLMKTIKMMLINEDLRSEYVAGEVYLQVSKMSRLFYFSKNKYFSINFPFKVTELDEGLKFSSHHILDVNNELTSDIISIVSNEEEFDSLCIYGFVEPIAKIVECRSEFWSLLKELLMFEDGYVRYDYDEEHENGDVHPLSHYDVFYSSNANFKVGLRARIQKGLLVDLLNIETDCHYMEPK